jgi:hypothetical protein
MSKLCCYNNICPMLKLIEWELNEKFTNLAEYSPTLNDGQRGYSFSKLFSTNKFIGNLTK